VKIATLVLATTLLTSAALAEADDGPFAMEVTLDYTQIAPVPGGWLQAFIPTGSSSEVCFVNLGDSGTLYGTLIEPPVCLRRTIDGQQGIVVILMPWSGDFPSNLSVRVSLYQKGARYYGRPVYVPQF